MLHNESDKPTDPTQQTPTNTAASANAPDPAHHDDPAQREPAEPAGPSVDDVAADLDALMSRPRVTPPRPHVAAPRARISRLALAEVVRAAPRAIPSICDAVVTFIHTQLCLQCGASTSRITFTGVRRTLNNGARAYVAMTAELAALAATLPRYTRHEATSAAQCAACCAPEPEEPLVALPDEFAHASKVEPLDDLRAFFSPSRQAASQQMQQEKQPRETED